MNTNRVIGQIRGILDPILKQLDLELVEVTFRVENGRWILRITIDCETGVRVEHCTKVSRELSVHLDVEDIIPVKYYLEVSSPGLDRPLKDEKDFERFTGRLVAIKTHRSVAGRKKIRGTLEGIEDGIVKVLLEEGIRIDVPVEDIATARLDFKF
ncbi:MAG: ribosome maturation factor RimP [bacterium]|nr:ribosome maturation factor RimP [bacterium]MDT8396312.1 ribosome maturation factor RimP [bacterium]